MKSLGDLIVRSVGQEAIMFPMKIFYELKPNLTMGLWNANRAKIQLQRNKNIEFLFHRQITENRVKQKHFVFVSLPNNRKLSETKTFCFCFNAKSLTTQ